MSSVDFSSLSYLVVDDEPFVLNLTVRILNKLGCSNTCTARNGNEALVCLDRAKHPVDIILCDLNMPEMDGVEFMRHAAEKQFTGGVIYFSAEDQRMLETATELAQAHQLNVLGVLPKPLNPAALTTLLANYAPAQSKPQLSQQQCITRQELLDGMDATALVLFYQPKVNIQTGNIAGVEALARWQHPERGLLGPGAFISLAEESGLIDALTRSIYRKAVQQCAAWQTAGFELNVSVNFSVLNFSDPNLVGFITDTASAASVDPRLLTLELTETRIMSDMRNCLEAMMRMRLKHFNLSIDDFGTGHSSMTQLKSIPFTELKIDRAFVSGAEQNSSAMAILESSIDLGRKLKMNIVAEGVETRAEWDLVERAGCDFVQGYYCAKPMSGQDLQHFLQTWSGPHQR